MSDPGYDLDRFETEWAENQDVLRNLSNNGDHPEIPRKVDVSFNGDIDALQALAATASEYGFDVLDWSETDEGGPWLFLDRTQTADVVAIRSLTITYLQIERRFGVECDGWGCMAEDGKTN